VNKSITLWIVLSVFAVSIAARIYTHRAKGRLEKIVADVRNEDRRTQNISDHNNNAAPGEKVDTWDRSLTMDAALKNMTQAEFIDWVNTGDPNAAYLMGREYYDGALKQDYKMAARYFHSAAVQSHSQALYYLATMSLRGEGIAQDASASVKFLLDAIELNNPFAMVVMGMSVEVSDDYELAIDLYSRAMKQFHGPAFFQMAKLALDGRGMEKDVELAYAYLNLAVTYSENKHDRDQLASLRDSLATSLGPDRLIEAQNLTHHIRDDLRNPSKQ